MGPSAQSFYDRLLQWLDSNPQRAAESYDRVRRRLIYFFEGQKLWNADLLADEVIDRVARRVAEGTEIPPESRDSFFLSTASYVALEEQRRVKKTLPLDIEPADSLSPRADEARAERERLLACLDQCLDELPPESRELLRRFYEGLGAEKLAIRKKLAAGLRIAPEALWSRVHRLRKKLETCMRDCASAPEVM